MIANPHAFRAFRDRWLTRCDELLADLDELADDTANQYKRVDVEGI